ncbi:hypothetical protein Bcop_2185 [Bacteroides coprosuis DSM 18011]|uniref:Uncharacterized protein n=1 Tax=Bacteroides coprosuis DSM 18011 TaxID=679937 RepID=F3ZTW5_9BACE|nr:hypothetical protein Bcop_2185 [Bacteroides coprosuis DSM 18011]
MTPAKIRSILNIIFLIGAAASVLTYIFSDNFQLFIYICGAAIFVKVLEFIIRFTN